MHTYRWPTSTSTFTTYDAGYSTDASIAGEMPTPTKPRSKSREIDKIMKNIATIIDQFGSERTTLMCDRDVSYKCSGNYVSLSHIYNPLKTEEEMSVPNTYYLAIILFLLDSIKDFKVRANIVREAITSLVHASRVKFDMPLKAYNRSLPRLLVFSKNISMANITDIMKYAGVKYVESIDMDKSESVCVTGSMISKLVDNQNK